MRNFILFLSFFFLINPDSNSQIINEINAVTSGPNLEFIELKGTPNSSLDGYVLVLVDGALDVTYDCRDLDGLTIDANGFFTIGNHPDADFQTGIPNPWLEDGADAVALYQMASCPSTGTACGSISGTLIDHIVHTSGQPFDGGLELCYAGTQHDETAAGNLAGHTLNFDGIGGWYIGNISIGAENSSALLPVQLISFEAKVLENNSVILEWQTASEENNSHFIIEHSRDGIDFEKIGEEAGMGNSNITQTYSMNHERLFNGLHYYRLKQVDFDGVFEYSNIISAKIEAESPTISIAPNPVKEMTTVLITTSFETNTFYQLINIQNQIVIHEKLNKEITSFEIDMKNLSNGIYFLRINIGQETITKKLIKI